VHTFHGHVFYAYFGKLKTTLFIWLERILGTLTSSIITISPRQRFDIVEKYKIARSTKVKVIPLGFELERFLLLHKNVLLKKDLGLTQDEILIGIVGRLVPIKNHKMMLRVLAQLRQNGIKVHLCIVGDGELRNELELLAKKLCIQNYAHFLGWRLDVDHIYANLDLLALTSFNEGTPVAIVEAMASRIPVVATQVGGVPDLIEHKRTGLLCQVNDVAGMTRKIEYVLAHADLRDQMLKNAYESVVETYHYNRLIDEMESLYKNLLHKRNGAIKTGNYTR
jgi:glycosyltransferase involved in cell wall biosynthesis